MRRLWSLVLGPALLYLALFLAMTYPAVLQFRTHVWAGAGDGLQMVWNLWWVDHAVTDLHQLPWHTQMLHYPEGTSLLVHTMHPLKGFMAIPLLRILSLTACYNTLVVFSFVMSGLTAFWLVRGVAGAGVPALLGGFIYTFSNYHFAHAQGHMQLVSMEWIPLFVLCWYRLMRAPRIGTALAASGALLLVLLCDHYYFLYCVLVGAFMLAWEMGRRRRLLLPLQAPYRLPLVVFAVCTLLTSGWLVGATLLFLRTEPQGFFFNASEFGMDALALLIPGGHWRFHGLTEWYWSRIPGKIHGSSVHLGCGVLGLVAAAIAGRRRLPEAHVRFWLAMGAVFAVLALGPRLTIAGWEVPYLGDWNVPLLRMPYTLLARVIPGLDVGARPVRLVVIAILCASVLAPLGWRVCWQRGGAARAAAVAALLLMLVEFLPSPLPQTRIAPPAFVPVLASRPDGGAVFDAVFPEARSMYFQTIHEHPISFGYISRTHASLGRAKAEKEAVYASGRIAELRDRFGFRYLVAPPALDVPAACPGAVLLSEDAAAHANLYDLGETKGMRL